MDTRQGQYNTYQNGFDTSFAPESARTATVTPTRRGLEAFSNSYDSDREMLVERNFERGSEQAHNILYNNRSAFQTDHRETSLIPTRTDAFRQLYPNGRVQEKEVPTYSGFDAAVPAVEPDYSAYADNGYTQSQAEPETSYANYTDFTTQTNNTYGAKFAEPSTFGFPTTTNVSEFISNLNDRYRVKNAKLFDDEEIKPSKATMRYAEKSFEKEKAVEVETRAAQGTKTERKPMTAKSKMMIAIYASIVVILAVLVTTTGILVSKISGDVNSLSARVTAQQIYNQNQNTQLDNLTDPDNIRDQAEQGGMRPGGPTESFDLVGFTPAPDYTASTNWFDRFCDWLSGVFGG